MPMRPTQGRMPGKPPSELEQLAETIAAQVSERHMQAWSESLLVLEHRLHRLQAEPMVYTEQVALAGGRATASLHIAAAGVLVRNESGADIVASVPGDPLGLTVATGTSAWWVIPKSEQIVVEGSGTGTVYLRLYNYWAAQLYR